MLTLERGGGTSCSRRAARASAFSAQIHLFLARFAIASSLSGSQFFQSSSLRMSGLNAGEGMMNAVGGIVVE